MWKCIGLFTIMILLLFLQDHVVISSPSAATTHLSPNRQKLALFQFRLSMSIDKSPAICSDGTTSKVMNWSLSSDCCTWGGVTCNQTTGDVVGLDLRCSQLIGAIFPNSTLFQLSFLQFIYLDHNNLYGLLPEEIFHLPNLQVLSVFYTNLTVSLPKNKWGSSSSLQALYLEQITLSGGIPDSIGYLKSLNLLSLPNCSIDGEIPKAIGNLTQLTKLDLSLNNLTGLIPDSLANLQNLTVLYLNNNKLSGHFPSCVANLQLLEELILSTNLLSGPLPSNLTALSLPNLTNLQIFENLLNGTIPSWLFDLPSLFFLSIDFNSFTGQLNEFNASRLVLQVFTCSNNLINGSIPESFFDLVNLTMLDLSSNNFSGVLDIEMFSHLEFLDRLILSYNSLSVRVTNSSMLPPQIQTLGLSSCKIKEFTHFFGTAENLRYLDLSNNQIHGEIPQGIGEAKFYNLDLSENFLSGGIENLPWAFLDYLNLQSNMLNGSLPASICNSSSLDVLNLSHNNLSGVLPTCPSSLDYSLSVLDVRVNSIRGSIPSALSNFRKLRSLNLYRNKLEGRIPPSFAELEYLEVLDLGSNQISDTFPQWLEALQNLQVLSLKSNKLHGSINNVSKVEHPFPSLRIIDLSNNEFSGPLPAKYIKNFKGMMNREVNTLEKRYMGDSYYSDTVTMVIKGVPTEFVRILTAFTTIDLSENNFEGEMPEFIGNLKSLRDLNLSHNHLSGHVPSLIGKLSVLESLDLSFNQLVGIIPPELTCIYTLSKLNLSYNYLSGHIPEGAQFQTFDEDSYGGNLALCGRPLSKRCNIKEISETQEDADEDDDYFFSGFTWEAVTMGYGSGVVVGFLIGYVILRTRELKWLTRITAKKWGRKVRSLEIRRFA
ncbi:hypothetical protein DCAR_0313693 [Daucus carota subsp. sativus]|uniref:Uncharacterized protein n=1 Tax=Daucus carota subsp. sativus TaxID=79200 RepID=A0A166C5U6_DAUCS|nr:PREDICTED: receptor-like protein 12 [Daucus carota subsp. sativus]WOG94398.1 hypothetical protein DCAR_0313693 [Daucus carota subsp. sativus]